MPKRDRSPRGRGRSRRCSNEIARRVKAAPELIRSKDRRWEISHKRAEAVALMVREYGYGVSEVAKYLGRDQANVSTMLSRMSARQTERSL
jgi:DNA-binding MarR family transcriptional regulator